MVTFGHIGNKKMAVISKRGKSWYLDWRDSKGRHKKTLGKISEKQAKDILIEAEKYLAQIKCEQSLKAIKMQIDLNAKDS